MPNIENFLHHLQLAFDKIIDADGQYAKAVVIPKTYVIDGAIFIVKTTKNEFPIWIGLNVSRLFFITYTKATTVQCEQVYPFCFGGAQKVGWSFNYEQCEDYVSIWGTCFTDWNKALIEKTDSNEYQLTPYGHFWVNDIALMAQSYVLSSERAGLFAAEKMPAPL